MEVMNKTGAVSVRKVARLPFSGRFILLARVLGLSLTLTLSAQEEAAPNFEVRGVDGPELANVHAYLGLLNREPGPHIGDNLPDFVFGQNVLVSGHCGSKGRTTIRNGPKHVLID